MKKLLKIGFLILFFGMFLTLSIGMCFAGPGEPLSNERSAAAPALFDKGGGWNWEVLSDTSAWVNQHFFGRKSLISLRNALEAQVFGVSGTDSVLLGREGWLFYEDTLPDYTGANTWTPRQRFAAARNIALIAEYCQSQGRDFAFLIAPNKNSVYGKFMPGNIEKSPSGNSQMLLTDLQALGVASPDLAALFGEMPETVYFRHDSHWNGYGAALAADALIDALGGESSYAAGNFEAVSHAGDLYGMLYPAASDPETDLVSADLYYRFTGNASQPDSITLLTESEGAGSLLCYRDSFGNSLFPYLADHFGNCRFSRSGTYDLTGAGESVVIELVERNLTRLLETPAIFPAPERVLGDCKAAGEIELQLESLKDGLRQVSGTLPVDPDETSPVYILCTDRACEASLLDGNGFSAYLKENEQVTGVAYYQNGTLYARNVR